MKTLSLISNPFIKQIPEAKGHAKGAKACPMKHGEGGISRYTKGVGLL